MLIFFSICASLIFPLMNNAPRRCQKKNLSSSMILLFLKSMYLICFGQNLSRVILNIQVHSTTNYHKKHTSFIANNNDMLNDLITRKLNLSNYYQRFSIVYHCWKHFKKSNNICILFIPQTPFTFLQSLIIQF